MVRFGILSTARIAQNHVIPAIQQASGVTLSGIASRDIKKAKKLATHVNAPLAFGSYEQMLDSDEIDAVYIPLPTSHHIEWTLNAIKAGKHVLCEKPIGLTSAAIKPLIKARDKAGVVVSEAFMVTYHPQWLKVRELLAKGAIGKLRAVEGSFTYFNRDGNDMRNRPELGGGALPDIGVYPLVTARFATGKEPVSVMGTVEFDPDFQIDRFARASVAFDDFDMSFYVSTQLANRQSMVFHGDKGFIEVSAPFNSNLYEGDEVRLHNAAHNDTRIFRFTGLNQYRSQLEAFARTVKNGKPGVFSLEESILNQKAIDAIYRAGKSGKRVKV